MAFLIVRKTSQTKTVFGKCSKNNHISLPHQCEEVVIIILQAEVGVWVDSRAESSKSKIIPNP